MIGLFLCQLSDNDFTPCSAIFKLDFKIVLTVRNFFNFHFISIRLRYNFFVLISHFLIPGIYIGVGVSIGVLLLTVFIVVIYWRIR